MVLGADQKGEGRRLKGKIREQNQCYGYLVFMWHTSTASLGV